MIILCLIATLALLSSSLLGKQDENVTSPNPPPQVTLSADPTEGKPPLTVTFTAEATDVDLKLPDWAKDKSFKDTSSIEEEVDGKILSYEWSGAVSGSGESVSETFEKAGTYHATVTVKCDDVVDGENEKAEATTTVTVKECPVCKDLKAKKARLETQLSQKRTELEKVESELKDKYKRRIEIIQRLQEINEELNRIANRGILSAWLSVLPLGRLLGLIGLETAPVGPLRDAARLRQLWPEKLKLLSEKKEVEERIKELESQRDRLKGEIEKIEKRIEEIDKDIASCKYPPTH